MLLYRYLTQNPELRNSFPWCDCLCSVSTLIGPFDWVKGEKCHIIIHKNTKKWAKIKQVSTKRSLVNLYVNQ